MAEVIYQNELPFPDLIWERPVHYYKHEAGRVFLVAGSKGVTNTAFLTSEAIFRSGTGALTLGFPQGIEPIYKEVLPESMMLALPETPSGSVGRLAKPKLLEQASVCDVSVMGPDISTNAETIQLLWELIFEIEKSIVITGDGVSALIKGIEVLRSKESEKYLLDHFAKRKAILVLVLNARNMERLFRAMDIPDVSKAGPRILLPIISEYLKSTIVYDGEELLVATTDKRLVLNKYHGDVHMNTCDILAGIVGSFMAQNPGMPCESICTGVYLYGYTIEIASKTNADGTLSASDIIKYLPLAIKKSEGSD